MTVVAEPDASVKANAVKLLTILDHDRNSKLLKIERYVRGDQDAPYVPSHADYEYKMLAKKSVTNVCGFIAEVPVQGMYVDSFRRGNSADDLGSVLNATSAVQPEWDHWQNSRLDTHQHAIYRGALNYGHSFIVTERDEDGRVISRGLSALRTVAIYENPASDEDAVAALTVTRFPGPADKDGNPRPGKAEMWDEDTKYDVTFKSWTDPDGISVAVVEPHGSDVCPVTRFTCVVDLEGRTVGVVEPMIRLQDRLNQGVFDLLVTSTYSSFKVRTVTGMAPPFEMEPVKDENGKVIGSQVKIDETTGQPVARNVQVNQSRFLFAESEDAKFGSLDETPLEGFINSIHMTFQHIAALSETPPHHLLGQIANLSAEALEAAESALLRKIQVFQASFGESWERVFRIAAQLADDSIGEGDHSGEVIWRDLGNTNLAQAGDALGKLLEIGIPGRGLWSRVPGVTANEMAEWDVLLEQSNFDAQMADAAQRSASSRPDYRETPAGRRDAQEGDIQYNAQGGVA